MADRAPRRRLAAVLLGTATPALLAGGLFLVVDARAPGDAPPAASASDAPAHQRPDLRAPARPATTTAHAVDRGVVPQVVEIPSLDVRAPVTGIRTEGGALTPPSDPTSVGWWTGGSRPGSGAGAAVLAGHTVHTGGGAFDDLDQMARGDRVSIQAGGARLSYVVRSVVVMGKDRLAAESRRLFGRSGAPRLVLVTCEDWDGTAYLSNVVVTAVPRH